MNVCTLFNDLGEHVRIVLNNKAVYNPMLAASIYKQERANGIVQKGTVKCLTKVTIGQFTEKSSDHSATKQVINKN